MIQLTGNLTYDPSLPLDEQPEAREFILDLYARCALLELPDYLRRVILKQGYLPDNAVVRYGNHTTQFDRYGRPELITLRFDTYTITITRQYQDASTAWKLQKEDITIK